MQTAYCLRFQPRFLIIRPSSTFCKMLLILLSCSYFLNCILCNCIFRNSIFPNRIFRDCIFGDCIFRNCIFPTFIFQTVFFQTVLFLTLFFQTVFFAVFTHLLKALRVYYNSTQLNLLQNDDNGCYLIILPIPAFLDQYDDEDDLEEPRHACCCTVR